MQNQLDQILNAVTETNKQLEEFVETLKTVLENSKAETDAMIVQTKALKAKFEALPTPKEGEYLGIYRRGNLGSFEKEGRKDITGRE